MKWSFVEGREKADVSESVLSNKVGAVSDRADASTPWMRLRPNQITLPLSRSYPLGQVCQADKAESRFSCTIHA